MEWPAGPTTKSLRLLVGLAPGRVGDDEAREGRPEQQGAADRLLAQRVGDEGALAGREPTEQDTRRGGGGTASTSSLRMQQLDQVSGRADLSRRPVFPARRV